MSDKTKHPGGAPSKYKPEYCETILKYFSDAAKKENGGYAPDGKPLPPKLPSVLQVASIIGVTEKTIYNWMDEYPELLQTINQCKAIRTDMLINNALNGMYNGNFAKFLAINISDMRDRQDVEHTGEMKTKILIELAKPDEE